ncbi:MAG: HRDC domain-containing protein [Deltaproteobacteria bacterium]|nr:HRDC domain-containing protein [Deltaproteobacteria bacterium]
MTTPQDLEKTAGILEIEETVGIDLEADSLFHYQEKVCLVQIATPCACFLVDPLQIGGLSPLKPFFANPDIRKVFHGSDYDIRSLYKDFSIEVKNLFDTQLACRFLGMQFTGLDAVLNLFYNIRLEKKFQKKDWSQRPLPDEMLAYASQDAIYLNALSKKLEERLIETGRLNWFLQECDIQSLVRTSAANGDPRFLKFKGAGRLGRRSLAVLEVLLELRDSIAKIIDRPLYQVIHNEVLLKLAIEKPRDMNHLKGLEVLSIKQLNRYGQQVLNAIHAAMDLDPSVLPAYPRNHEPVPGAQISVRIAALKKWRESTATYLEIESGLLCNNALITAISQKNPQHVEALYAIEGIKPWQIEAVGKQIVAVLQDSSDAGISDQSIPR